MPRKRRVITFSLPPEMDEQLRQVVEDARHASKSSTSAQESMALRHANPRRFRDAAEGASSARSSRGRLS